MNSMRPTDLHSAVSVSATPSETCWELHRCALSPWHASLPGCDLKSQLRWIDGVDQVKNIDFLQRHGLAGWWADNIALRAAQGTISESTASALATARRTAVAHYLIQSAALSEISTALELRGVVYAVLKGVATREEAYATPALRTAGDIDLLVDTCSIAQAVECMGELGFVARSSDSTHEITLSRGQVDVDLHWDILRPGRTRRPLVGSLLARRERGPKFWRLSDVDTVFLMLVHPAITKYVCSPHMGLNRVLDFLLFTQSRRIEWDDVASRMDEAGLKTAGWCTIRWIQLLVPNAEIAPASFLTRIQPGKMRSTYLDYWLVHDLPGRFLDRANWLIKASFTLPMHDTFADAWRAFRARAGSEPLCLTANAASR